MISVKVTDHTGTIILDRPARCNALGLSMVAAISEALDDLRLEKRVRGVVLTGTGSHFCAGADVKELHELACGEEPMKHWFETSQATKSLLEQMLHYPKPIVAAVDGCVIAEGFALVLACDLIVASHRAEFSIPSSRLGIVSGLAVPLLSFRAGAAVASQVAIGGETLKAQDAKHLGLVHHLVEADQIWVRAQNWVESISADAAEAVQLTKKVLNETVGEQLQTMLASGAAAMATSLTTEAAAEGLKAFVEKREPAFP